jgi:glutathione S-transferase
MPEVNNADVVLFHAPNSRSTTIHWLLHELGEPYTLKILNLKDNQHKTPELLAANPLGKVPTLVHRGAVVTESAAICTYLADAFPKAGLAPAIGDPLRGPYLRWMFFGGSTFEPAIVDRAMKREEAPAMMSPYGSFDATVDILAKALQRGPYLLGEKFTAADVFIGSGVRWTTLFKLLPERPEFARYIERLGQRPALQRSQARDAEILKSFGEA